MKVSYSSQQTWHSESESLGKAPEWVGIDEPGGCPTLTLHWSHKWASESMDLPSLRKFGNFSQLNTVAFKMINTKVLMPSTLHPMKNTIISAHSTLSILINVEFRNLWHLYAIIFFSSKGLLQMMTYQKQSECC